MHERRRGSTRRRSADGSATLLRGLGLAGGVVIVLVALAGPVGATAEQAPPLPTTCSLPVASAAPGTAVTAGIEHVVPGTQVTLTVDGGAVGDAVAGTDGAAAVIWTIPVDAPRGDHSVVFVGENVYCEPAAPIRVTGADDARTPALAEGTVGAAAGRAPAALAPTPGRSRGGRSPAPMAAAVAAVAVAGGGVLAWRRRRLRIPG